MRVNKPVVTPNETGTQKQAVTPVGEKVTENVTGTPQIKEYTLKELAEYNGKNRQ